MFALEGALVRAGASPSVVGIYEASAPLLVLGLLAVGPAFLLAAAVEPRVRRA